VSQLVGAPLPHNKISTSWVVRDIKAGLKQRLKKLNERLSKELKKTYQQLIRAWRFVEVHFGDGNYNFIMANTGGRN
jgi:hypothetical protein